MTDPTDLIAQAQADEQARQDARTAAETAAADLVWLMGHERGRRIVWRLLADAGVYRLSYSAGDAMATAFREGGRNLGLAMLSQLMEHCPDSYSLMMAEARTQ